MKKTLLGTTALVTAGLLAGPALASDPLKVTVGGNIVTGFYVVDQDDIGSNKFESTKVPLVARNIFITGEGTLDNGIVAGATVKMRLGTTWYGSGDNNADASNVHFDEAYGYFEGGFGRFEIGSAEGAAYRMHYTSPWFVPGNGVDSPNIFNANVATPGGLNVGATPARTSTYALMTEDANKISYFTPRIVGFQLGASFTPDVGLNDPQNNGFGSFIQNDGTINTAVDLALNYSGDFDGFTIGTDGFYSWGQTDDATGVSADSDPQEWGFGANLGYAGFTLGGAYYRSLDLAANAHGGLANGRNSSNARASAYTGDKNETWTAGLSYGTGPWTVGVAYLTSKEKSQDALVDGGKNNFWQVGGGYELGAGVKLGLDLELIRQKSNRSVGWQDGKSGGLVLAFSF
ncbi:MAG: porin [Parvibaculaceae bacterium]|nr:porin [Parvibaculaceae bacterium]